MACLDTNFIIDFIKGKIDIEEGNQLGEFISISSPSIVEIIRGLHLKKTLQHIKQNEEEKIENTLNSLNILQLNKESAKIAGRLQAELINKGEDIGIIDILIAAITLRNNETLITRNLKHFHQKKSIINLNFSIIKNCKII